jgi:ribosomal protein S27E
MANHAEAISPVNYGEVRGPYVENVECPNPGCKQLNPTTTITCFGCGQMLIVNA